ncbi:hypothetical protein M0R45_005834 [Rubus argutus]|uniref:Uncharacterized protein n=1 Tax=Rubus argutus TaxID=59490 RepID=A0AAW1YNS4_RUBAR
MRSALPVHLYEQGMNLLMLHMLAGSVRDVYGKQAWSFGKEHLTGPVVRWCPVDCEYRVLAAAPSLVPRGSPLLGQRDEVIVVRLDREQEKSPGVGGVGRS